MSTRIIEGKLINEGERNAAYLYDSVTGWCFGPQFDSAEDADNFLDFLGEVEPRLLSDPTMDELHGAWLRSRGIACGPGLWAGNAEWFLRKDAEKQSGLLDLLLKHGLLPAEVLS